MTRARELADLLTGGQTISTADNTEQIIFKSTDADASAGPLVKMHRESGSPADGDALGRFNFIGENDADEEVTYARIHAKANDVSDGTEDGELLLLTTVAGTNRSRMAVGPSETVFNEDSVDVDFRVESNGNANMLFVDAGNDKVAIGTGTAVGTLTTECTAGDSNFALTAYHPTSTSARTIAKFQSNVGSTQADKVTILCDGKVGIDNGTPTQLLSVGGASSGTKIIQVTNSTAGTAFNDGMQMFINDSAGGLNMREDYPLQFYVNGAERARIDSSGNVLIASQGTTSNSLTVQGSAFVEANTNHHYLKISHTSTNSGESIVYLNRQSSDGEFIQFRQANSTEGTISVSGTTVSFTGGHLSRWSRLADDSKDTNIVKGTVMTNLDKMVVWHHEAKEATFYEDGDDLMITPHTYYEEGDTIPDGKKAGDLKTDAVYAKVGDEKTPAVDAYDEDNEQLNCMAVSSVEGDANVAGVFVNWDESDDFNDMNIAMTGDMVIRIASGTTVARGDLLMSAGDGTAKPQGDDIVRSKTIAKVTSITKSHTYDDGSYLVPCVLMAC